MVHRHATTIAMSVFGLIAFSRSPYILTSGRFWAEEGSTYFYKVLADGSVAGLTFVYQRAGYLHLLANVGTWLASLIPLSTAPLATSWLSFSVVLLLLWIVLAWPSSLIVTRPIRILTASLLLLGASAQPEVWLNTINSQTYLGVIAVVLLLVSYDDLTRARYAVSLGALLVAGLSGLYAAVLAPLYWARAWREKTSRSWAHAGVVTAALVTQLLVVLSASTSGELADTKLSLPSAADLLRTTGGLHLSSVVLGRETSWSLVSSGIDGSGRADFVILLVAVGVLAGLVYLLAQSTSRWVPLTLLGAFVLNEALVQFGAHGSAGGRYSVVPVAIVTLALAHGAEAKPGRHRAVVIGVLITLIIIGLGEFWTDAPTLLACQNCPSWAREVELWQADPSTELRIWPYPVWTMRLP
jgi:hypothetical protein